MQNLHGWPKYKKWPLKICKVRDNSIFCLNILISQIVRNVKFIYDNSVAYESAYRGKWRDSLSTMYYYYYYYSSDDDEYAKLAWGAKFKMAAKKTLVRRYSIFYHRYTHIIPRNVRNVKLIKIIIVLMMLNMQTLRGPWGSN